jgi:hypothetical protein
MRAAIATIAAAALLLAACGRHQEESRTVTITAPGGNGTATVTIGSVAPSNLPAFVKVFPGAKVTAATTVPGGGVLAMETNAAPEAVMDFYKKAASDAGLPVMMDSAIAGASGSGASHLIQFGGESVHKSLQVNAQAQNGVTKIAVLYGASPN